MQQSGHGTTFSMYSQVYGIISYWKVQANNNAAAMLPKKERMAVALQNHPVKIEDCSEYNI
jgi:hypothetical protein